MKKTIEIITTTKETYQLSENLLYVRLTTETPNTKDIKNSLIYTGKLINGYPVKPIYDPDLDFLKVWNPFWGKNQEGLNNDYSWFNFEIPENPGDVDISKIVFTQSATHQFFDNNLLPIPVVIRGDEIEAGLNNENYDLSKLKSHFDTHPNLVSVSEILQIPYYNSTETRNQYLDVLVLPEREWMIDLLSNNKSLRNIFPVSWDDSADYLNIRQFFI